MSTPSRTAGHVLDPFVRAGTLAGAVTLVADRDKVLSIDSVGFADRAARRPMRPDTLFWIASQSKPITAGAFMMLVDEGKVQLDEPVERRLPEFRNLWLAVERDEEHVLLRRPSHPVTMREILSHTSGMPFASPLEQPTLDVLPLRESAAGYAMTPLDFEPGSRYQYSNAGINTIGRIIEVLSGTAFEDFLDKRLLRPLGMKDTTFWPGSRQLAGLATSYKPTPDRRGMEETPITQLRYPLNDRTRHPVPAGGLFSTAGDLARFCRMVLRGGELDGMRYLTESTVREMTRRQTPESMAESYGLGWSVTGETFGHGGAYSTSMTIDPRSGLISIYLVQHSGFPEGGEKGLSAFMTAVQESFEGAR